LKCIFFVKHENWDRFVEKYGNRIRPNVIKEVEKFRTCGRYSRSSPLREGKGEFFGLPLLSPSPYEGSSTLFDWYFRRDLVKLQRILDTVQGRKRGIKRDGRQRLSPVY
jgi:hypothetical protein